MDPDHSPIDPEILVAALSGEATEEEVRILTAWRAADPGNEAHYQRMLRTWSALPELEYEAVAGDPVPAEAVIRRSDIRLVPASAGGEAKRTAGSSGRPWGRWARRAGQLAAALVLGFVAGSSHGSMPGMGGAVQQVVTGVDQVTTVRLADGTVVRLAPRSRLSIPEDFRREVVLDGRAYFSVPSASGRRFRVRTEEGVVTVFGTRFDAGVEEGEIRVIVVEGHVAVEGGGHRVDLTDREMGTLGRARPPSVETVENVYEATAWLGRFLAFESTPLGEVVSELGERLGLTFRVEDPDLNARTLTGWFTDQSPQDIVTGICSALDVACSIRGDTVTVTGPSLP